MESSHTPPELCQQGGLTAVGNPYRVPAEKPACPLPGPKHKQAEALYENILWAANTFGRGRIGFLTLTFGDQLRVRREASARWNRLLTGVFRDRYLCGVNVSERHKSGAIHFHLVVVTAEDIRGGIDFAACFPNKRSHITPDYRTAPLTLRNEWEFLRGRLPAYKFGRHQLQPMKHDPAALADYVSKYISKSWSERTADDKGARLINYFGSWTANRATNPRTGKPFKCSPPQSAQIGWMNPQSRAWRECCKQIARVCRMNRLDWSQETVRRLCGQHWALFVTERIKKVRFFEPGEIGECALSGIHHHNRTELAAFGPHVGEVAPVTWVSRRTAEVIEKNLEDKAAELAELEAAKNRMLQEILGEINDRPLGEIDRQIQKAASHARA